MKKLLAVLAAITLAVGLSGCEAIEDSVLQEQINTLQAQIDNLDSTNSYTKEELDEIFDFAEQDWTIQDFVDYIDDLEDQVADLQPNQLERFMYDMMLGAMTDGSIQFMELDRVYTETVNPYGYSATYIYEVLVPTTYIISTEVDNDLEFCYYVDGLMGDEVSEDLKPTTIFHDGLYQYTLELQPGFFAMDFESWDGEESSTLTILIQEVE